MYAGVSSTAHFSQGSLVIPKASFQVYKDSNEKPFTKDICHDQAETQNGLNRWSWKSSCC